MEEREGGRGEGNMWVGDGTEQNTSRLQTIYIIPTYTDRHPPPHFPPPFYPALALLLPFSSHSPCSCGRLLGRSHGRWPVLASCTQAPPLGEKQSEAKPGGRRKKGVQRPVCVCGYACVCEACGYIAYVLSEFYFALLELFSSGCA